MKRTVTFTFTFDTEGLGIGETLDIDENKVTELLLRAEELTKNKKSWGEVLSAISEEFSDNEFLYVFGWLWFMNGIAQGREDALREVAEAQEAGRMGA